TAPPADRGVGTRKGEEPRSCYANGVLTFNSHYPIVATVRDVEHSGCVHRNAVRLVKLGFQRVAAHASRAFLPGAGHADDGSFSRAVFAECVIVGAGDEVISLSVDAK